MKPFKIKDQVYGYTFLVYYGLDYDFFLTDADERKIKGIVPLEEDQIENVIGLKLTQA